MTSDWPPLTATNLQKDQPVAYAGPDEARGIHEKWTHPQVLRKGHPGRIADPSPQHIRVNWVGLEHEPISYAVGFCLESIGGSPGASHVPGLALITESEFEQLAEQVRATDPKDGNGAARPAGRMIEADLYVMYGSTLPFQQVGLPFPEKLPAPSGDLLAWDENQRLLVITTGTPMGAVRFQAEELAHEPPLNVDGGWEVWQELSVNFDTGAVRLRDLEADEVLLPESLVSHPGRYRVRLYAKGRDSGVELQEAGENLVERYLLQLWPTVQETPATSVQNLS